MQQSWGAPCCGFTASKNTSRQCHYFAFKPAMLSATASPFTAFPLQIHRSLRKVKKAGPVYFGRWNIFWKSNRSAIFSFRWLREQREPRPASVNSRTKGGDMGDHMIAAMPEQIDTIFKMNYNVAQIKVSPRNHWSRMSECWWLQICHSYCHWGACSSSQPPTRQWQNQGWHLSFQHTAPHSLGRLADLRPSVEAAAGCTTQEWKLILFTFNLLFPPFWNLERVKSCNTCIKNKCSRNGPTGSMQREAFVAWPRGPAAKSNRYAQYFSTYSRITITHIQTSTCSRENKGAYFLCPCRLERGGEYDEK